MSLNSIVTNVAAEAGYAISIGADAITSQDTTAKQLVAITQRVVREAFDTFPWWQFNKTYSFPLVDGQTTYPLPGDFSTYHFDTWWNQSTRWRVLGPMGPQEYGELVGFGNLQLTTNRFTLQGVASNQIIIYPAPGPDVAGQIIVFQYMSARPVKPWTWTANTSLGTKTYAFYNGNYYSLVSGTTTGTTPPTHTSGSASDGSCTWAYFEGAYETFQNGEDTSIIPERVIEQGVLERFAVYKEMKVQPLFDMQLQEEYSMQQPQQTLYTATSLPPEVFALGGRATFRGKSF